MPEQPSRYSVAWQAVRDDDAAHLEELFEQYPEVKVWSVPAYGTWLHCAASDGSLKVFEYLLSCGTDLNVKNRDGITPLVCAASSNQLKIVRLMLKRGAEMGSQTAIANPLFACISGSAMDTHPVHSSGNPPTDRLEIAKLLLDAGLDPALEYDLHSNGRMDALKFAWLFGRRDIARLAAERLADGDLSQVEAMLSAADRALRSPT
jgi:ankyrin repeat protein